MKMFKYVLAILFLSAFVTEGFSQSHYSEKRVYKHKKGWSPEKKDAVIGAGAGAILGAVLDKKNRGVGAVVGGVVGGGTGYLVGRHKSHEIAEDRQIRENKQRMVMNRGYRTGRSNGTAGAGNYLTTSESNAAFGNAMGSDDNYFHNPAYGYQRKSW